MSSNKTIFKRILDKEIPADVIHEDDRCIAFRDVNPQAPTHILIIPRKEIASLADLSEQDGDLVGHLIIIASTLALQFGLKNGYRVIINCGQDGGQTVDHLHVHLIGGRRLDWPPG